MSGISAPSRDEAIAAVLDACDGHHGRVSEYRPAPAMIRMAPAPLPVAVLAPASEARTEEIRACEECWQDTFRAPRSSTRRLCDACRERAHKGQAPLAPAAIRCPFCLGTFTVDMQANVVTHSPSPAGRATCGEFSGGRYGYVFMRKAARHGACAVEEAAS